MSKAESQRSGASDSPAKLSACDRWLADRLRDRGLVEESLLGRAEQESHDGGVLAERLAEHAPTAEGEIYRLLAEYYGSGFEPLGPGDADESLAEVLPSDFAIAHFVVPVRREDDRLVVATSRPEMLVRADQVSTVAGSAVRMALAPPSRLQRHLQGTYGLGAETVSKLVGETAGSESAESLRAVETVSIQGLDSSQEASVTKFVNQVLVEAVKTQASDVHIEPYERALRVRFRVDGVLQEVPVPPTLKQLEGAIVSRIKVLADLDIAEKRLGQDGQVRLSVLGRAVDVRVSVLPSIYGESLVLRLLDRQSQYRDLGELGMPEATLGQFREVLGQAQGLILVTGPTGSGKTTSLYAALNHVNLPGRKIITVEDPVEYRLEGITQIQVRESIGLGFSSILRNIVRHDPDVIMVGEIRDSQTTNLALNAAITGHLVLATFHTNDAPTAVTRLANMGAPWYMIASSLKVVVAQRLLRVLCGRCKRPAERPAENVLREFPELEGREIFQAVGCEACHQSGYAGRTGIFETMVISEPLAEAIATGERGDIRRAARGEGLVPLRRSGADLVARGITSIDELYRVTRDVASLPAAEAGP